MVGDGQDAGGAAPHRSAPGPASRHALGWSLAVNLTHPLLWLAAPPTLALLVIGGGAGRTVELAWCWAWCTAEVRDRLVAGGLVSGPGQCPVMADGHSPLRLVLQARRSSRRTSDDHGTDDEDPRATVTMIRRRARQDEGVREDIAADPRGPGVIQLHGGDRRRSSRAGGSGSLRQVAREARPRERATTAEAA